MKQYQPETKVKVDDIQIPFNSKLLGVTFVILHYFTPQAIAIADKVPDYNKFLELIVGSNWRKDLCLHSTYKTIIRMVINYAAQISTSANSVA